MEYSFAPLYVRIAFFVLLGVAMSVVGWLWSKKQKKQMRILICVITVLLGFVMAIPSIFALINPQIKTITCTFSDYEKGADQLNPFSVDCEVVFEGKSLWIELDTITQNTVFQDFGELEQGKTYTFVYEERQNLILGIYEE